jgi:hydroxymethyl cephem carbamoyltransferase
VLVWESLVGSFYLLNERFEVADQISVMPWVGVRYNFLFRLADPNFPDHGGPVRFQDAGKLMALAAYGDPADADDEIRKTVERILDQPGWLMKHEYRDTPLHNVGVESAEHKTAAALLTARIFERFAEAAVEKLPRGIPLHVAGGCGLNCDWNFQWRELGHFSSVFVPPCANDSGSSVGHAIDAIYFHTGDPYIDWDVYAGREFDWDQDPDPAKWRRRELDERALAAAIGSGQIVGWVQGKWEIGPRALGNRSILAEPFNVSTRDRLNEIKQREGYRPIAPCCRVEDLDQVFNQTFEDPHMLFFRTIRSDRFGAITHVDGSARCQTVTESSNAPLHRLLSAFAEHSGVGVMCNTSLNFKRRGFINNMSDLAKYCESRGLDGMVVGDAWFEWIQAEGPPA